MMLRLGQGKCAKIAIAKSGCGNQNIVLDLNHILTCRLMGPKPKGLIGFSANVVREVPAEGQ
jgi:hypothetical protein